jgi:hypothetical protein
VSVTIRRRGVAPGLVLTTLALATAVAFLAAGDAEAERGITTGIAVPEAQSSDSVRDLSLDGTAQANADLIRFDVLWRNLVGSQRPTNPRDPADPAYDFSRLDAAVRGAEQRGLKVHFTVYSAPAWAEGPNRRGGLESGAWRPDPGDYGDFGSALAKRYSGSFSPAPGLPPLPRVRYFEAWNEPNLEVFLAPQWVGDRAEGPAIYRQLLNSFYDAVKGVDPGNIVVSGGTTSFGDPPGGDRSRPVFFLRELFCLEGRKELQLRPGCAPVKMDVLGHHPISTQNPPTYSAISPDDAAMTDIDRLRRVLRAAEKAGVVQPGGKRQIWATEFWWHDAVPAPRQARYIEQALYVLWKQRVEVAIHYLIRDSDPYQGLIARDGKEKPAFQAFRFPFVTERLSRKRVRAWGRSPQAGKVKIQAKQRGGWRTLKRTRVSEDEVFTARLQGSKKMRAQIGDEQSLVWQR